MEKIEYNLGNNKLYFLPEYNKFYINKANLDELEKDFYDTSLMKLRIEISHACNGRCKYCLVFGNNVDHGEYLNIKDFWEELTNKEWFSKIKRIFIIGGEPLLFFDEISFILDHFDGRVSFSTNGTLLTDEMAKKFSKSNVAVYISLDGPTFEDNMERVYADGSYMYDDIIKGLHLLEKYGVEFGIFMVASKNTISRAKEMIMELDSKYHPNRIGYSLPHWASEYDNVSLAEEFRDALFDLFKNRSKINAVIPQLDWRLDPLCDGKIKRFSCGLHTTQTTVLPDKTFVRCSKIDNIYDNVGANITNEMLDANSPIELAKDKPSSCANCIALSCCGGGCPFDGMKRFKCLTDKRECIITPPLIELAVKDVVKYFKSNPDKIKDGFVDQQLIKTIVKGK
jgi:radical SAM protein with 4Fe4S-binding SPASM domain